MYNKLKALIILPRTICILLCLQGCMAASTSLSADEAFALSASALSGIDRYSIEGEVVILGPAGKVSGKAGYEGEVTGHGNLKLKWRAMSANAASDKNHTVTSYQPLKLLELFNEKSTVIQYSEASKPKGKIHFNIKLNDRIALDRVKADLRAELKLLRSESDLLKRAPKESDRILTRAEKRLEQALETLRVTTVCDWTANQKDWLPQQFKEQTVMTYTWNNQSYKEERTSVTHFHLNDQDDTIKGSKGLLGG